MVLRQAGRHALGPNPTKLELPYRIAVPRLREPPATSRRRFCLPCTMVDHAHFGPEGNTVQH